MRLLLFMTASAALWAQGPNIEELFKKAGAASDANEPKARQYLYREYKSPTKSTKKANRRTAALRPGKRSGSRARSTAN